MTLCIRSVPNNDDIKISFCYDGKKIEFNRKKSDTLKQTLNRVMIKLQPKKSKKKKKEPVENKPETINITLEVFDKNEKVFDVEETNENCFVDGTVLVINSTRYSVVINPPTVIQLKLPDNIMDGFQVFTDIKFEFATLKDFKFQWYRSVDKNMNTWEYIGDGFTYTPNTEDISYYLKCKVTPIQGEIRKLTANKQTSSSFDSEVIPSESDGITSESNEPEVISSVAVSAGPGVCLFDERHIYTPSFLNDPNQFRIVCYNILADIFADSEFAKEKLYPYAPEYVLKEKYRSQLIMKELFGYHADLICLQECQTRMYEYFLKPIFVMNGYGSSLMIKVGEMPEGSGLFYRKERYEHLSDFSISIRDAMGLKCNEFVTSQVPSDILEIVRSKNAIGQIHLLRDKSTNQLLCVLNTHLYFERRAIRVRLFQIIFLMNYMHAKLTEHCQENSININDISVIVCGDLNSNAHIKALVLLRYLSGDKIAKTDEVWSQKEDGTIDRDLQFPLDVQCPIKLSLFSGYPEFTVYVPHCKTTLDYIFGSRHLQAKDFIPLPDAEQIDPYVGLPCVVYPSDHLAVVMNLEWKY